MQRHYRRWHQNHLEEGERLKFEAASRPYTFKWRENRSRVEERGAKFYKKKGNRTHQNKDKNRKDRKERKEDTRKKERKEDTRKEDTRKEDTRKEERKDTRKEEIEEDAVSIGIEQIEEICSSDERESESESNAEVESVESVETNEEQTEAASPVIEESEICDERQVHLKRRREIDLAEGEEEEEIIIKLRGPRNGFRKIIRVDVVSRFYLTVNDKIKLVRSSTESAYPDQDLKIKEE